MDWAEKKSDLRKAVKAAALELDEEYRRMADQKIITFVTGLEEYRQARTIFCFVGRPEEIDTMPVIKDALRSGKRVGAPACVGKGIMEARRVNGPESLAPGAYGILEPGPGQELVLPGEIDFAVIPCLSCSHGGERLGYGGGYYDRYLSRARAVKAVICRELLMREDIPTEAHDQKMDIVISEVGVIRI